MAGGECNCRIGIHLLLIRSEVCCNCYKSMTFAGRLQFDSSNVKSADWSKSGVYGPRKQILKATLTTCAGNWLRTITNDQTVYNNSSLSVWTRWYDITGWKLSTSKFIICFAYFVLLKYIILLIVICYNITYVMPNITYILVKYVDI